MGGHPYWYVVDYSDDLLGHSTCDVEVGVTESPARREANTLAR